MLFQLPLGAGWLLRHGQLQDDRRTVPPKTPETHAAEANPPQRACIWNLSRASGAWCAGLRGSGQRTRVPIRVRPGTRRVRPMSQAVRACDMVPRTLKHRVCNYQTRSVKASSFKAAVISTTVQNGFREPPPPRSTQLVCCVTSVACVASF